ncbi:MAG: trypsin-like peptidase domain-containing protein [Pseudomonadota bacterium]
MAESYFLTKTNVDPGRLLSLAGSPAIEQFEGLHQFLTNKAGRDAADLFAEPVMSRGNGTSETTVSWYVSRSGEGRPISELAPDSRAAIESQLRRTLTEVSSCLSDPDFGPLLGAALHLDGNRSIWAVDGKPFLIDWAMAPVEAQADPETRQHHFSETLGRFLPIAMVPAITREEWQGRGYGAAPARSGSPTPTLAPAAAPVTGAMPLSDTASAEPAGAASGGGAGGITSSTGAGGAGAPPQGPVPTVAEDDGRWRWRWIAPIALLVFFATALIWVLWPGNLLYPPQAEPSVIEDDALVEAARAANRTLEERIRDLRVAVEGAVCLPDGRIALPDGRTPDGRPVAPPVQEPTPGGDGEQGQGPTAPTTPEQVATAPQDGPPTEDGTVEIEPDSLTPQSPAEIVTPSAEAGGDPVSLLDVIEARTVMVVAVGAEQAGHGTGFVVGPELVLTNFHVVQPAQGQGRLLVTSEGIGQILPAELIATSGPLEQTGDDFALVRVPGLQAEPYQVLKPPATLKLQQVVAAGYPGFALETDATYDLGALIRGDAAAVPDMVMTQGVVNAEQTIGPQSNVVIHTANISSGNSGGPLVDSCGRVVGINTFGRGRILDVGGGQEQSIAWTLNFALSSADFIEFLEANGVTPVVATDACRPRVRAQPAAPPPSAAPEEPVEARTPVEGTQPEATPAEPPSQDATPAETPATETPPVEGVPPVRGELPLPPEEAPANGQN